MQHGECYLHSVTNTNKNIYTACRSLNFRSKGPRRIVMYVPICAFMQLRDQNANTCTCID